MSLLVQLILYGSAHIATLYCVDNPRQSRNIIGLLNTSILSLFSIYSFYVTYTYGFRASNFLLYEPENLGLNNSIVAHLTTDLIFGHLLDRKNMELVSGYLHHSAYIGILYYLQQTGQSNLIYLCLPYEIPTFFLNLNRFDSRKRFTLPFGISFVMFRLIHNLYVMVVLSSNKLHVSIATLMLVVHLHWFRIWLMKQSVRRGVSYGGTGTVANL